MNGGTIVLSPENLAFASERASAIGKSSPSDYIDSLLHSVRLRKVQTDLDAKLLDGLRNEFDPAADDFLEQLEMEFRQRAKGTRPNGSKPRRK